MQNSADPLAWILAPYCAEEFTRVHWEKQPLFVPRSNRGYYEGMITLAQFDDLLSTTPDIGHRLRVVHEGKEVSFSPPSQIASAPYLEQIFAQYRKGATISVTHLHDRWPPLTQLCERLTDTFSAECQVNAYLTPRWSQGLSRHYDTHDVFVLQVEGTKRWNLGGFGTPLPLRDTRGDPQSLAAMELRDEIELTPGDMLYIPRGIVHEAISTESASFHLTIGVKSLTYADLLSAEFDALFERDSQFRAALPIGFDRDSDANLAANAQLSYLLTQISELVSSEQSIDNARNLLTLGRRPSLNRHILDLEAVDALDEHTEVRRRPTLRWQIEQVDLDTMHLTYHGKVVSLPASSREALAFMATGQKFTAIAMQTRLDMPSRLLILKKLLSEGFLTLATS
ncbi:cupin domain-containing protein [Nocardia sp. CA-120079]|uniref:cupin domain-containing protein n=1 Tax=Nocardia sp. CA-120079 TaxID=3239974 RepID=UPI003D985C0C